MKSGVGIIQWESRGQSPPALVLSGCPTNHPKAEQVNTANISPLTEFLSGNLNLVWWAASKVSCPLTQRKSLPWSSKDASHTNILEGIYRAKGQLVPHSQDMQKSEKLMDNWFLTTAKIQIRQFNGSPYHRRKLSFSTWHCPPLPTSLLTLPTS